MKTVFNSLGVNYSSRFRRLAWRQLFNPDRSAPERLLRQLENEFQGKAVLTYKGRQAITLALQLLGIKSGDLVFAQAFTCHAVETAIIESGAKAVFVDLASNSLNFSVKELDESLAKVGVPRALVVQHTLGFPARMQQIRAWCNQHQVLLIEDLAQAVGARIDGKPVGSWADAVVLSFGRDKILDAVSGGACIIKNQAAANSLSSMKVQLLPVAKIDLLIDLLYPQLTWLIRSTDLIYVGKAVYKILRLLKILKSPVWTRTNQPQLLPSSLAALAELAWQELPTNLEHRKTIGKIYQTNLKSELLLTNSQVEPNYLRFPILVERPQELIAALKKEKIYLSDRWYRQPVDSGALCYSSHYQSGSCPQAEIASKNIVNLPTHQSIDRKAAARIIEIINRHQHAN